MKLITTITALACTVSAFAQSGASHPGFTQLNGIEYKIIKDVPGKTAQMGEVVEFNIVAKADTLTVGDTYKQGKPAITRVEEIKGPGQFQALFPLLSAGDSAVIYVSCDTILKTIPADKVAAAPKWLKSGAFVTVSLSVVSVMSLDDYKNEMEARQAKEKQAADEHAKKQQPIDEKILQDYFAKNNIKAQKTPSGLYYTIKQAGSGDQVQQGQTVSLKYTGKTLDGKAFDSNIDTAIGHHGADPLVFNVGQGQMIPGIDEGVTLLKSGSKATIYIPSPLGYGAQSPMPDIPSDAILVFEVEVEAIQPETIEETPHADPAQLAKDDKILKAYFTKKNIKAKKTASGLYYTIQKAGTGSPIKKGQSVSIKYTGKSLNGHVFDSNIDAAVAAKNQHATDPLTFAVGKGEMIPGVDEGAALLKKGSKATFYLPSPLAYGTESPTPEIAPNSILVFEVEVTGVK